MLFRAPAGLRRLTSRKLVAIAVVAIAVCSFTLPPFTSSVITAAQFVREIRRQMDWPFVFPDNDPVNNPDIIKYVQRFVLEPPSSEGYQLEHPNTTDPSEGMHISKTVVPDLFPGVRNGVFFEAGALDGETVSTTLYLERELGWSGMLAEMTPINHDKIRSKHRKAFFAPVCLSPNPWPIKKTMGMEYDPDETLTRWKATIVDKLKPATARRNPKNKFITYTATVECYPLQTLLLAANITRIDFLSLDLEGAELQVLKTLEWEKFDVKVIHLDLIHTLEGSRATTDFLLRQGFELYSGTKEPVIFLHKGFMLKHKQNKNTG